MTIKIININRMRLSPRSKRQLGEHRQYKQLLLIIWAVLVLFILSSCENRMASQALNISPSPTSSSGQIGPYIISAQNANTLVKIQTWNIALVSRVAWAKDSLSFAISGDDGGANKTDVYSYTIGKPELSWSADAGWGMGLTYTPDNKLVAAPGVEFIKLLDAKTGKEVAQILNSDLHKECISYLAIAYTPDGSKIITMRSYDKPTNNAEIFMWDVISGKCMEVLAEEEGMAFDFKLSRDGRFLAIGLRDIGKKLEQQVHVWDIDQRRQTCNFNGSQPIAFSQDGRFIAAGDIANEGNVGLWNAKTCKLASSIHRNEKSHPFSMDFSPDGTLLAIGGSNSFQIWDISVNKLLFESPQVSDNISQLAFSPDGMSLLSIDEGPFIGEGNTITLWRVAKP